MKKQPKSHFESQKEFLRGRMPAFVYTKDGKLINVGPKMKVEELASNVIPLPRPFGWRNK